MACATILYKICRWSRLAEELSTSTHMYSVYNIFMFIVVVVLLFYIHRKQLRSCRDGQLPNHTFPGQAYGAHTFASN